MLLRALIIAAFALPTGSIASAAPSRRGDARASARTRIRIDARRGQQVRMAQASRSRRRRRGRRRRSSEPAPLVDTPKIRGRKAPTGTEAVSTVPAPGALRRSRRIEFDGRLVQGQTAKSGAIYLFARKRSELRSMVVERQSFRTEVVRTLLPNFKRGKKTP